MYLPNVSPFCAVKHQLSAILTPWNWISDRIQSLGLIDVKHERYCMSERAVSLSLFCMSIRWHSFAVRTLSGTNSPALSKHSKTCEDKSYEAGECAMRLVLRFRRFIVDVLP